VREINRLIGYIVAALLGVLITGAISENRLVGYEESQSALFFALVLGVINAYIKPVISLVSIPITCLTFGLFALVINATLFGIAAWLVPGVTASFWGAVLGGLLTSLLSGLIFSVLDER
jgi:putative membrane protein